MKNLFVLIIGLVCFTLSSCEKDAPQTIENIDAFEYLSFGHMYGECLGESCVEIFRIDDTGIAEDVKDDYPSRTEVYQGNFVPIADMDVAPFEALITSFPEELLNETEIVLGCPDCADQGGYYLEISKVDGTKRFWVIDTNKSSVPSYLHDYMDAIFNAIESIN